MTAEQRMTRDGWPSGQFSPFCSLSSGSVRGDYRTLHGHALHLIRGDRDREIGAEILQALAEIDESRQT